MHTLIQSSSRIGIFTHMNPDGDALGSSFGMAGYLMQTGHDFRIFLPDAISENLTFMIPDPFKGKIMVWNAEHAESIEEEVNSCDLVIGVDFNTPERIGAYAPLLIKSKAKKILIDHHVAPVRELFDMVHSETETSSACQLVFEVLKTMPEIGGDASKMTDISRAALLTGMTTDTNNFNNSTYPGTFLMASELIAAGTDRDAIIQNLYFRYPQRRIQAQSYMISKLMHITPEGVAYMIFDRRVQKRFGLREGDTEGFVNVPLSMENVNMSIFFKREMKGKKIRVSIRSKKGISARNLAMKYFHGGGHEQASGGRLMVGEDIKRMSELANFTENCVREFFME